MNSNRNARLSKGFLPRSSSSIFTWMFLVVLFSPNHSWSQGALYIPGSIPLEYSRRPATDIMHNGHIATPDELVQLRKQGLDLSELNPVENTEIWQNVPVRALNPDTDRLELRPDEEVEYLESLPSVTGNFRFTVRQKDRDGHVRVYRLFVSKNAHSILLRKNLLRKLGYNVPKTLYLPRLNVRMKGTFTRKIFLQTLSGATLGEAARWIINTDEEENTLIKMQDLIAFEANESFYNLSNGYLSGSEIIRGRRLLNSLIVPYALVNVQETVNGFSWIPGRILNDHVLLNVDYPEEFSTPLEDALWILKRIARLKRQDFEEIVRQSHFPEDVGRLLIEKLISRRNWLISNFNLNAPPIPFDTETSYGQHLVLGELKKERWDGHAARYAYTDPESPLSSQEIKAFFKSKGLSTLIETLAARLDNAILKGTDIEKKVIEKQIEAARKEFIDFLKTGRYKRTPFGMFAFPTIDGEIWVSRDVVIGRYMGAENPIQLADTFEASVSPGVFAGAVGLPAGYQLNAGAQIRLGRSYTHLRNIKSVRRALKEPFRNLLVSLLKKENGHIFDELLTDTYQSLEPSDKEARLTEIMASFNEAMGTGDSFIISNNISQDNFISAGYSYSKNIQLQASIYASQVSVGRLHIMKKSENTIHIYRDHGDMGVKGFQIGLKALIPIITVSFNKSKGTASTRYYSLDLNPKIEENEGLEPSLLALRQVFLETSFELLDAHTQPYHIQHQFKEKVGDQTVLFFNAFTSASTDRIEITHPKGAQKIFVRTTEGTREGPDYQGLTVNALNAWIEDRREQDDISIPNPSSGDPGDTFKGRSTMRNAAFEVEVIDDPDKTHLGSPFLNINYRWKGWKTSEKKMLSLLNEVNEKFGYEIFSPLEFTRAESFQLYAVDVNLFLYEEAIFHLSHIRPDDLRGLLEEEGRFPRVHLHSGPRHQNPIAQRRRAKDRIINSLLEAQRDFIQHYESGQAQEAMEQGVKFFSHLEMLLPFERLLQLVGGEQNIFVYGQVTAFREGDENGDLPVTSNSLGRFGEERPRGGLSELQSLMGISPNEFYLLWLLRGF